MSSPNPSILITRRLGIPGRRAGFTLVEILVTVGVIMALMGIVMFALRSTSEGVRKVDDGVALQTLRSMYSEYKERGGDMARIDAVYGGAATVAAPSGSTRDGQAARTNAAVLNTAKVIAILLSVPENKKAWDNLPENRKDTKITGNGPLLLDSRDCPYIFVRAGGLTGVRLSAVGSGKTITSAGVNASANTKPFWASSGPDFNFAEGDDNQYSFEK